MLCWVFVSVRGLSLVVASGSHSSSRCAGLPASRPLSLRSTGSRRAGSAVVAHGPSCSAACGILPDQGPNPCPLHRQADSQPLRHQGSPTVYFIPVFTGSFSKAIGEVWKPAMAERKKTFVVTFQGSNPCLANHSYFYPLDLQPFQRLYYY